MSVTTKAVRNKEVKDRPVIICTSHRGVFFGYAAKTTGDIVKLRAAKMAIYWGTSRGVMELANTGPTTKSRISLPADIELRGVTAVFEVTKEAEEKWSRA